MGGCEACPGGGGAGAERGPLSQAGHQQVHHAVPEGGGEGGPQPGGKARAQRLGTDGAGLCRMWHTA